MVREKAIPKSPGKVQRLGIPTTLDRFVQAALKLVLEPIFEADFKPCSTVSAPGAERSTRSPRSITWQMPTRNYQWMFEARIAACFDEIEHAALIDECGHES